MGANGRQERAGAPPEGGILMLLNGHARTAARGMRPPAPVCVDSPPLFFFVFFFYSLRREEPSPPCIFIGAASMTNRPKNDTPHGQISYVYSSSLGGGGDLRPRRGMAMVQVSPHFISKNETVMKPSLASLEPYSMEIFSPTITPTPVTCNECCHRNDGCPISSCFPFFQVRPKKDT